jgi:hypothetical protein
MEATIEKNRHQTSAARFTSALLRDEENYSARLESRPTPTGHTRRCDAREIDSFIAVTRDGSLKIG